MQKFVVYRRLFKLFGSGCLVFLFITFISGLGAMLYFSDVAIEEFPIFFPWKQFTLFEVFREENKYGIEPTMTALWFILSGGLLNVGLGMLTQRLADKS